MERKLTAILSADVKGYSRLMGEDEEATIRTLTAYREVTDSLIQQHRGRIVGTAGDSVLAEFASAVDAVQCAVEIQHALKVKNTELPTARQMEFRIGINVGDVVVEGEQIYGDGVNVAARLQGLADAGGIFISGTIYDQIENKLALNYEYLGEQLVKNIVKPVRTFRVRMEFEAPAAATEPVLRQAQHERLASQDPVTLSQSKGGQQRRVGRAHLTRAVLILAGLVLIVGGIAWYLFSPTMRHQGEQAASLPLPLKPSIAVLPFTNMSSDPEQEYFSDGMTDTLITDLSKLAGLFVIARNSTFVYKGKAIKPQQVSQELGVRYVLEGSVQKADTRVRIIAQLVDATTGTHLWAEHYDRELKDIFALQDEITRQIVGALQVKLTAGEQARVGRVPTDNLEAYDYYLRGKEYFWRSTPETNVQARQLFERAIELDPQFALAYTWQGITYLREWAWLWSLDPQTLEQAFELAQKAITLDDSLATAYGLLGLAYARKGQPEQGLAKGERGIALDPNCAECYIDLAEILLLAERPEEALGLVEKAMRLDPQAAAYYSGDLGWAYRLLGRYEEAIAAQKRVLTRNPDFLPAHGELARMYHELGRAEEAQAEEAAVRRLNPYFPLEVLREKASLKERKEEFDRFFKRSLTDNLKARAYFFGGFGYFFRNTQEAQAQARQMWEKAIELDPQFAWAHTFLCATYLSEWTFQWSQDPQTLERAMTLARRAVALDDSLPLAHEFLGVVYMYKKQYEHAIVEAERSIALDPNDGDAYANLGLILAFAGQPEEAIKVVEKGMHLNSRFPARHLSALGMAYRLTGQYEKALDALQKALPLNPNWLPTHLFLAVIYSELGREEEARAEVGEILRLSPNYSLEVLRQRSASKDPAETERYLAALRKTGLK